MGTFNIDVLDPLHARLSNNVHEIDGIVQQLDAAMSRSTWMGPHRDAFQNNHYAPLRANLLILRALFEDGDESTLNLKRDLLEISSYLHSLESEITGWVRSEAQRLVHEVEHLIGDIFGAFEKVLGIDPYALPRAGDAEWHTWVLPVAMSRGFRPWVSPPE